MVALVFLVLGFQIAVFVIKVIETPDQVRGDESRFRGDGSQVRSDGNVVPGVGADVVSGVGTAVVPGVGTGVMPGLTRHLGPEEVAKKTKYGGYARPAAGAAKRPARHYESFAFDPNTVSVADLQRLGLSERQAATIENYRSKGGRFRTKEDFRKMYVVSDTLFARLEPFIEIPKLELNTADSAALVSLRGIGPYYARKILAYRQRLGGFYDKAQLLEIEGFDQERYAGLADEVTVDPARIRRLDIWHASDSLLAGHPYLGARGARSLVRYRQLYDSARWTLPDLARERVIPVENIEKLKKYIESQ